jgi:CubicO group peptidase (beta-lactamase class C family)
MTSGLRDNVNNDCTLPQCLIYQADAGTRWAYHNAPYTLLDTVLQHATGQNLNSYFNQKLRNTTGMSGLFLKQGFNNVFFSRPRSMARFGLLLLGKGRWNNNQIITDTAYLRQMTTTSQSLNQAYGYLTWLNGTQTFMLPSLQLQFPGMLAPVAPLDMYAALGKNGQVLCVVPSQNLLVIRMGNNPDASAVPVTMVDTLWQHMNRVMCNTTSLNIKPTPEAKPSLVNNQLTFDGNQAWQQVAIFDVTGKQLKIKPLAPGKYELSSKPKPGIYYFKAVNSASKLYSGKLILQEE